LPFWHKLIGKEKARFRENREGRELKKKFGVRRLRKDKLLG
jgi:hypothetical protein